MSTYAFCVIIIKALLVMDLKLNAKNSHPKKN